MSEGESIASIAERKTSSTGFQPTKPGHIPFGVSPSRLPELTGKESLQYDPKLAYLMAMSSAWAYSDGETLANKLHDYGFVSNTVLHFSTVNLPLFVAAGGFFIRSADGRLGVLIFRGTEPADTMNWLAHADRSLQPFHGGMIHAGVHANVEAIWGHVDQLLNAAALGPDGRGEGLSSLYLAGHGLGAAMAVVVAARLFTNDYADLQPLVKGVYTYGQPMVGDLTFARQCGERFGDRVFRHVFRHDPVPSLPSSPSGRLAHFGREWVSNSTRTPWTFRAGNAPATVSRPNGLVALGRSVLHNIQVATGLNLLRSLDDHLPSRYVDACRAALAK